MNKGSNTFLFKCSLAFISFFIITSCFSQNIHNYNNVWFRLFLNDRISEKWRWEILLQNRREATKQQINVLKNQQLNAAGLWFHYALNEKIKLSVQPLCYFETKRLNDLSRRPTKEWRWCLRAEHKIKLHYFQILNRMNLEYRWRNLVYENQYKGNFRARYMLRMIAPLGKINERPINLVLNDEILIQFGDAVQNYASVVDQNRIYCGFSYEIFKHIKLDLAYMHVSQNRPSGNDIDIQNAITLYLTFENVVTRFKKVKANS